MFGGLEAGSEVVAESFFWRGKNTKNVKKIGDLMGNPRNYYTSTGPQLWTVGEPTDWETLGDVMGKQVAPYLKASLTPSLTVHCNQCGKTCTKARGEVLTRKGVFCGKCYDEGKHGPSSTITRYGKEGER